MSQQNGRRGYFANYMHHTAVRLYIILEYSVKARLSANSDWISCTVCIWHHILVFHFVASSIYNSFIYAGWLRNVDGGPQNEGGNSPSKQAEMSTTLWKFSHLYEEISSDLWKKEVLPRFNTYIQSGSPIWGNFPGEICGNFLFYRGKFPQNLHATWKVPSIERET